MAYPTADRRALAALRGADSRTVRDARDGDGRQRRAARPDRPCAQSCAGARGGVPLRVCIDVDAGWWALGGRVRVGAKRSPVHTPEQAAALARAILARDGLRLVGIMSYEAQIAGLGDTPAGRPLRARAIRAMQRRSATRAGRAPAAAVDAVERSWSRPSRRRSSSSTAAAPAASSRPPPRPLSPRSAAGSGLYAPALFDAYRAFTPRARRAVRAARRAPARARRGHGARRRLPRLRPRRRRRGCRAPYLPGRAAPRPPGGRRRGADAAARRRRRRPRARRPRLLAPREGRRAVRALQRVCICSKASGSWRRCRPTAARSNASCEARCRGTRLEASLREVVETLAPLDRTPCSPGERAGGRVAGARACARSAGWRSRSRTSPRGGSSRRRSPGSGTRHDRRGADSRGRRASRRATRCGRSRRDRRRGPERPTRRASRAAARQRQRGRAGRRPQSRRRRVRARGRAGRA